MACPVAGGAYQVFAALGNATVPNVNLSACLGFDALVMEYYLGQAAAAWEYA